MKTVFKDKFIVKLLPYLFSAVCLLLNLVISFIPLYSRADLNLWTVLQSSSRYQVLGFIFIGAWALQLILLVVSDLLFLLKKYSNPIITSAYNCAMSIVFLSIQLAPGDFQGAFQSSASSCIIITLILSTLFLIYSILVFRGKTKGEVEEKNVKPHEDKEDEAKSNFPVKAPNNKILLIFGSLTMLLVFTIFAVPLYTCKIDIYDQTYFLFTTLSSSGQILIGNFIILITFVFLILFSSLSFISSFTLYFHSAKKYLRRIRQIVILNTAITAAYFLAGYIFSFVNNVQRISSSTISFIPLILMIFVFSAFTVYVGKHTENKDSVDALPHDFPKKRRSQIEALVFVAVLTGITCATLAVNVISIKFGVSATSLAYSVVMNGFQLLTQYGSLSAGLQTLSFVEFVFLITSGSLLLLTLTAYFSKMRDYGKVVKTTALANVIMIFLLGISGMYFSIGQKITEESIYSILESFGVNINVDYFYSVSTQTIYLFLGSLFVLVAMMARGHFNILVKAPVTGSTDGEDPEGSSDQKPETPEPEISLKHDPEPEELNNYDVCPAFTEIDGKIPEFDRSLAYRKEHLFTDVTLPKLVNYIVEYARDSRLHLSYSAEDIATFVAGLGASRLSILQGMSGTGKTSLPKIFTEAVMGNCEIVEVESSWRDKNELLGYYNEFSKCYTPKKFTQSLYRAVLNPEVPTFIVLDEMNLSRIEYYFSDFLSLMENEEDKREIKLLNVKLYRIEDRQKIEYRGLTEGHTIIIPKNVWFIGTANRDESTFEISDKVYDRAQTMNFTKRAPKIRSFQAPISQQFLTYNTLSSLLSAARDNSTFDIESDIRILEAEKLLSPYNISFGNRVLMQMEEFVSIYCACLVGKPGVTAEAVEKILLSKVVSKLEFKNVEDKEELAQSFDNISLHVCSSFIRKLNED